MVLSLFHYTLGFFGNVPTENIAVLLKNRTVRRVLTAYYYKGKTVNVFFRGVEKELDVVPSKFLKVLHGFCKEKNDVFKRLKKKHCQIPALF